MHLCAYVSAAAAAESNQEDDKRDGGGGGRGGCLACFVCMLCIACVMVDFLGLDSFICEVCRAGDLYAAIIEWGDSDR